jgi:molybdopterin molybdotransferase
VISVEEAVSFIQKDVSLEFSVEKKLIDLSGQRLAQNIYGERNQPPFDRVAMDGIAINLAAWKKEELDQALLIITGIQQAGEERLELSDKFGAIEVMTGAPLPTGCDCVIRYEDISIENEAVKLADNLNLKHMQNVHREGSDFKEGELILKQNIVLDGPKIAAIASQGLSSVKVIEFPKVAIVSTGNELIDPGKKIKDYQIRKSNSFAIQGLLNSFGFSSENISTFHLEDNKEIIHKYLVNIFAQHDLVILTGGISMGKFDFLPSVFNGLEVNTVFHKITQKPGKPMLYGRGKGGQYIFSLPGNPVSSLICLRKYLIEAFVKPESKNAVLTKKVEFKKKMTYFLPVTITYDPKGRTLATPVEGNGSGDYIMLSKSDGFIELNKESDEFFPEEIYPVYMWRDL